MSMRDNPCSGYVLEAKKLLTAFDPESRKTAQLIIEDGNWEGFQDFLEKNLPVIVPIFPVPVETFIFGDEDTSDDMEQGKMYCRWEESQLYVKLETPEMRAFLPAIGCKPELYQWAIWG